MFTDVGVAEDHESLWKSLSKGIFGNITHAKNIRLGAREFSQEQLNKPSPSTNNIPDLRSRISRKLLYQ
jgi:hypothetical protein